MMKDELNITDPNFRLKKTDEELRAEEQSLAKLRAAEEKEQRRLSKRTLLDRFLDAIFKVKKKSATVDQARNQQNQR